MVLVLNWCSSKNKCITSWYDPATNQVQIASEKTNFCQSSNLCVVKDQFMFVVNGEWQSVEMLDTSLQSHCFVRKPDLLTHRPSLRVGVLNNCIYAVGCCIYIILLLICYDYYTIFYIVLMLDWW